MPKVYISGPLTGIDNSAEAKLFYENIGSLCQEIGLQAHIPHLFTDPINHPHVTPKQVFETDKYYVNSADLIIAYIGYPSIGVGMELAYAEMNSTPIILLYEKNKVISRFPRGIPTIISEIQFDDYSDALKHLRVFLYRWLSQEEISGKKNPLDSL